MKMKRLTLQLYDPAKRDNTDRRKVVTWAVFEYLGEDNNLYRQSFTFPKNTPENQMFLLTPEFLEK